MQTVFYALDGEFAAATGANVGTNPGSSRFDNPPQASLDLVITANVGDPDPSHFEIGDTYDISFGGIGGGTLEDAIVVRSDPAPDGGGIIVFSGTNEDGDPTEVIWTPDFDLVGWYSDNYNPSAEPEFFVTDQDPAYTHEFVCFAAFTRIKTPDGDRAAGDLRAGDMVMTLDHGAMVLIWTGASKCRGIGGAAPVVFEPGSIGNNKTLHLSQQHRVMLRSFQAELLFGAPEVFVPAKALINGGTIRFEPCRNITYVHLLLPTHQVLNAEGAPCESLLMGDMALDIITAQHRTSGSMADTNEHLAAARPVLTYQEARLLVGNTHDVARSEKNGFATV